MYLSTQSVVVWFLFASTHSLACLCITFTHLTSHHSVFCAWCCFVLMIICSIVLKGIRWAVRSTPLSALIQHTRIRVAVSLYYQTVIGRTGFAIISITGISRTYKTHTDRHSHTLMDLILRLSSISLAKLTNAHTSAASITTLLRQSKRQAGWTFIPSPLKASHLQGWGSWLKHRTGTTFAHRHTSERTCSTITVGVLTLIQFISLPMLPVFVRITAYPYLS